MRVLVTGASGAFGAGVVRHLTGQGYDVVALSRRAPEALPARVSHEAVDIRDAARVQRVMDGVDVVAHLAWATVSYHNPADSHSVNVDGTRNVLDAMAHHNVPRIIFTSSATVYGPRPAGEMCRENDVLRPNPAHLYAVHKVEAEHLVRTSGLDCLIVRAANGLGRSVGGLSEEAYAAPIVPGIRGASPLLQLIHIDDIGRFYADAIEKDWAGPVNLAAADALDFAAFVGIIGRLHLRVPMSLLRVVAELSWRMGATNLDPGAIGAMVSLPVLDTTRLCQEFGFRCAWSSHETAEDFARRLKGVFYLGRRRCHLPWNHVRPGAELPADQTPTMLPGWHPAAPPELAGEFDSEVIPGYEAFTATNTSEAFPGPLTPLTVEMAKKAMCLAGYDMALMVGANEPLKSMLTHHQDGIFGHALYANLRVIHDLARSMPGYDPAAWDALAFGRTGDTTEAASQRQLQATARQLLSLIPRLLSFPREVRALTTELHRHAVSEREFRDLSDESLDARFSLLFDLTTFAWAMAAGLTGTVMAVHSALDKQAGGNFAIRVRGGMEELASAGAAREVERLAALAHEDPRVADLLTSQSPERAWQALASGSPDFASAVDAVIGEYGHRGPREWELASSVFGEAPERLIDAIAKRMAVVARRDIATPALHGRLRVFANLANRTQSAREQSRDVALRFQHLYRLTAKEIGRRYTERGLTTNADDIFYLVRSEISHVSPGVQEVIDRRRAERERLSRVRIPISFVTRWEPDAEVSTAVGQFEELSGIGVSGGIAAGPVRLMDETKFEELEPGDVLVARLTDAGWTVLFTYASAVVTELGGVMSHAAVVARELGVPCVVMATGATTRLRTGQLVEVDGHRGVVRCLESSPEMTRPISGCV